MENDVTEVITDPEILKDKYDPSWDDPKYREIPVRIVKHGNRVHKTETRIFAREIHENFCDQSDCEFYGKHASQGNCWKDDEEDLAFYAHLDRLGEDLEKSWNDSYGSNPDIEDLKSIYITTMMNWDITLDECIRLRAENARLKNRLGEYK